MIVGKRQTEKPIRWAMVGGGGTSQIGYIHRSAALRDRTFELVAGAFDIDPARGKVFGVELGVAPERCYPGHRALFAAEASRADGVQAVSIATPNNTHYEIARAALEHGIHVVCEKPLCFTVAEAEALKRLAEDKRKIVGVTYGYAGHQMIEQARALVAADALGVIRLVNLQFAHGFHSAPVEEMNPATNGASTRSSRGRAMCSATSARIRSTSPRRSRRTSGSSGSCARGRASSRAARRSKTMR